MPSSRWTHAQFQQCDNTTWDWLTLVMQLDESGGVLLVTTKSDGDLVAPATQYESPHQD